MNVTPRPADQPPSALEAIPTPVTAVDRLQTLYRSPGPYTSVYLGTAPLSPSGDEDTARRWQQLRRQLAADGAPEPALNAIEARLALPSPEDTAGVAVIAAADGTTVVDHGLEAPRHDLAVVDTLPYAAPLLEWQQRRVAHLVVTVDETGGDIATFGADHFVRVDNYTVPPQDMVEPTVATAAAVVARLVIVVGDPSLTGTLADALATRLPVGCHVTIEPMATDADELADIVVRHVSDLVARTTVDRLREQRFMATHDAAVDGTEDTVLALAEGTADTLMVHDDPDDRRLLWIGSEPNRLSLDETPGYQQARLVDALIRSAVLQAIPVWIIPRTGPDGPTDDAAALIDPPPVVDEL